MRQLKQRVTLRCELLPFDIGDTAAYMSARITTAGGVPSNLFTSEAVRLIHQCSWGIPRTINVICDNVLLGGMALGRGCIDSLLVREVCRDLRLTVPNVALDPPPPAGAPAGEASAESLEPPQDTTGHSRFGFRWRTAASTAPSTRVVT